MMSEPVNAAIINGLCGHLRQIPLAPSRPIAYPLNVFSPVSKVPYLQARPLLRADPSHAPLDPDGTSEHRGIFQVDVVWPKDDGELKAVRIASEVAQHFKNGTKISQSGFHIRVAKPPSIRPVVQDEPWIRVPVRISYLVFAPSAS